MTEQQEVILYKALRAAVLEVVNTIGIDGVREMSMFPSSKWNAKNDNHVLSDLAKAA